MQELKNLSAGIIDILTANKAIAIQAIDVTKLTNIAEQIIICSAMSTRHAKALGEKVQSYAKKHKNPSLGVEGYDTSEWILIDLNSIIVHIMLPEIRKFYNLEKLWNTTLELRDKNNQNFC